MNDLFVVPLTKGHFAIVDAEDAPLVAGRKWQASYGGSGSSSMYAIRGDRFRSTVRMHREIIDAPTGLVIDHINGNSLDNRKANLRACTQKQNSRNRKGTSPRNTSGYTGVRWDKSREKWAATIMVDGKNRHIGRYLCPIEAAIARDIASLHLHRDFASLNFPSMAEAFKTELLYPPIDVRLEIRRVDMEGRDG